MQWTKLSSTYLFRETWFTVRKDSCMRPDGKVVDPYYVFEFPEWVTAFALTADGKVILERQYRHAIGLTSYELPGGCIDPEDSGPEAAIARELEEETGYRFDSFEYLGKTCANPSTNTNWMHMFLARGGMPSGKQQLDDNEDIEVHLASIEELKEMLRQGMIIQSMHVTGCFYALQRLEQMRII